MRLVPEIPCSDKRVVEDGIRQACNAPIQMGAQGVIKRAMGGLIPYIETYGGENVQPLLQTHDDLLFHVREEMVPVIVPGIKWIMENSVELSIPLPVDVKVGKCWGKMEKWKEVG